MGVIALSAQLASPRRVEWTVSYRNYAKS